MGNFTLQDWRDYMTALDGSISVNGVSKYNQYMDNHNGVYYPSAVPYLARLKRDKVPYFTRRQNAHDTGCDVFVQVRLPAPRVITVLTLLLCSRHYCAMGQKRDFVCLGSGTGSLRRDGVAVIKLTDSTKMPRCILFAIHCRSLTTASSSRSARANAATRSVRARSSCRTGTLEDKASAGTPTGARTNAHPDASSPAAAALEDKASTFQAAAPVSAAPLMRPWKMTYASWDPAASTTHRNHYGSLLHRKHGA